MPIKPMVNSKARSLDWAYGSLSVQRLGAMLAPARFDLPGGRSIEPMHMPPWAADTLPEALPPILRGLRGEWPCVPFGADEPESLAPRWQASMGHRSPLPENPPPHGESSNDEWDWLDSGDDHLCLKLTYPPAHPIAWVEREIVPDPDAPAINLSLRVMPRTDCRLPMGLHPTFALPATVGKAHLTAPKADHIRSYPGSLEPGAEIFAPDAVFHDLKQAPAHAGGTLDASRLPFKAPGEDLLQLVGVEEGCVALENHQLGYRVTLTWNAEHFPSLLIWYSNRGRQHPPWNGRHTALGLEPICSAFDLGAAVANHDNPIAASGVLTSLALRAGAPFQTRYTITVSDLD